MAFPSSQMYDYVQHKTTVKGIIAQHVSGIVTRSCCGMSHRGQAFYAKSCRAQVRDKNCTNYETEPQTKTYGMEPQ